MYGKPHRRWVGVEREVEEKEGVRVWEGGGKCEGANRKAEGKDRVATGDIRRFSSLVLGQIFFSKHGRLRGTMFH